MRIDEKDCLSLVQNDHNHRSQGMLMIIEETLQNTAPKHHRCCLQETYPLQVSPVISVDWGCPC